MTHWSFQLLLTQCLLSAGSLNRGRQRCQTSPYHPVISGSYELDQILFFFNYYFIKETLKFVELSWVVRNVHVYTKEQFFTFVRLTEEIEKLQPSAALSH